MSKSRPAEHHAVGGTAPSLAAAREEERPMRYMLLIYNIKSLPSVTPPEKE
jgi:hypothetical protein